VSLPVPIAPKLTSVYKMLPLAYNLECKTDQLIRNGATIMKERIAPLLLAAAGAVLALGVLTFAGPCVHDDGSAAACAAAAHAVLAAGIIALIAGFAGAVTRGIQIQTIASIVGIAAGIFATVAPGGLFPLCMMQTMRCWTMMRPFSLVLGVVVAVAGAAMLFSAYARNRQAKKVLRRMAH